MSSIRIAVVLFTLLIAGSASANYSCEGSVMEVDVNNEGYVYLTIRGAGVDIVSGRICNLVTKVGLTEPAACESMHRALMTALLSGRIARTYFTGTSNDCTHAGDYAWRNLTNEFYHLKLK